MSLHKFRLVALALLALVVLAGAGMWASRPTATASAQERAGVKAGPRAAEKKVEDKKAADKDKDQAKDKGTPSSRAIELRDLLRKTVDLPNGYDDPKTTLGEALDSLSKIFRVPFDVDVKAFAADKVADVQRYEICNPNPIPPMKTSLAVVLKRVLARVPAASGATFLIRKDYVEITTSDAVRRELGLPSPTGKEKASEVPPLPPLVFEEFNMVPLVRSLRDVAEDTGVNVVVDPRVEKKATLEVTATLRNVPVRTAVEVLADMGELAVVQRNNVIYVTSPKNAKRLLEGQRWSTGLLELPRKAEPQPGKGK
jgi:hypothetical protein